MTDMAKLRLLESELEASSVRREFLKKKAAWVKGFEVQRYEK